MAFLAAIFRANAKRCKHVEEAMELLRGQGLDQYKDEIATSLSYGPQRRAGIARALATLLDEPAAGMNPQGTRDKRHLTVFLIVHHMDLVMKISDYLEKAPLRKQ